MHNFCFISLNQNTNRVSGVAKMIIQIMNQISFPVVRRKRNQDNLKSVEIKRTLRKLVVIKPDLRTPVENHSRMYRNRIRPIPKRPLSLTIVLKPIKPTTLKVLETLKLQSQKRLLLTINLRKVTCHFQQHRPPPNQQKRPKDLLLQAKSPESKSQLSFRQPLSPVVTK